MANITEVAFIRQFAFSAEGNKIALNGLYAENLTHVKVRLFNMNG
jgi:hypothetical protein